MNFVVVVVVGITYIHGIDGGCGGNGGGGTVVNIVIIVVGVNIICVCCCCGCGGGGGGCNCGGSIPLQTVAGPAAAAATTYAAATVEPVGAAAADHVDSHEFVHVQNVAGITGA